MFDIFALTLLQITSIIQITRTARDGGKMSDFQKYLDENLSKVRIDNISAQEPMADYDIYSEISEMIISERKRQKITQKQLSQLTGISQANICNIEKGSSKPTIDSLKKISDALGKRLSVTFEDREELS